MNARRSVFGLAAMVALAASIAFSGSQDRPTATGSPAAPTSRETSSPTSPVWPCTRTRT